MKINPSSKAGIIMNNEFLPKVSKSFLKIARLVSEAKQTPSNQLCNVQQEESSLKSIEFFWSIHIFHVTLSLEGYFFFIFLLLSNEHVVEYVYCRVLHHTWRWIKLPMNYSLSWKKAIKKLFFCSQFMLKATTHQSHEYSGEIQRLQKPLSRLNSN